MNARVVVASFVCAVGLIAAPRPVHTQVDNRVEHIAAGSRALAAPQSDAGALAALRASNAALVALNRSGELVRTAVSADPFLAGRTHERYEQRHRGVRVFGGGLTRQLNQFGQAESIFGAMYNGITIDVTPAVSADRARQLLSQAGAGTVGWGRSRPPELVVLPMDGAYRLTWSARVRSLRDGRVRRVFVDGATGATVRVYDDTWSQSRAVGSGIGVLGDQQKVTSDLVQGRYLAVDQFRPFSDTFFGLPAGANITFDMKNDPNRFEQLVIPVESDIASDTDDVWTDPGIVDAHAYVGWTYDFYYKRFGRQGLDNNNLQVWTFTHAVNPDDWQIYFNEFPDLFVNAFYLGDGTVYYGVGLPPDLTLGGQTFKNFAGGLDIVAHELSHGVTQFTSNLVYQDESGSLNEAFSDVMAQSTKCFYRPPADAGVSPADWQLGGEVEVPGGVRNFATPFQSFGDPDHYSLKDTDPSDNGGVHTNVTIVDHAFYLSIMGGKNRVSGLSVQGVGFANRDQIERTFYRGFTLFLTENSVFSDARAATIQAARDLYGAGSAVERAITQAWTAVGVV